MKVVTKTEVIVIAENSPKQFQRAVNNALADLADDGIEAELKIDTSPLVAIITFTRDIRKPESIADEYNLQGIYAKCYECEQFEPDTDGRKKHGYCRAHSGLVRRDKSACDTYYQMKDRWIR